MPVFQPPSVDRERVNLTARGLISESYPILSAGAGVIPTTGSANGSLVGSLIPLVAGDVITNIVVYVTVTGASLTLVKLGLYDKTGVFLKASADVDTSFNSGTGYKVIALSSTYTVTTTDGYYAAYVGFGSGATGPTLMRGTGTVGTAAAVGSGVRGSMAVASQTDMSGNITPSTAEAAFWFGVS